MTTETMTTRIKKGHDGWNATTQVKDVKGYDWEINTFKGSNKKLVCVAQAGKLNDEAGYSTFSFMMFGDPRMKLAESDARASEKSIAEVHAKGLEEFIKQSINS